MRYLRAALVALVGGVVAVVTVTAVALIIVESKLAAAMQRADDVHDSYVRFAHVHVYLGTVFLVGFTVAFAWFLRRQRRDVA